MKRTIIMLVCLAIGIALAAWIAQKREDRAESIATAQYERDLHKWEREDAMRVATIQATKQSVRMTFGEAAASEYELCATYPPSVKANQVRCAKLMERIKRAEAAKPKW